jgi:predicted RNA polymerase sigma factor
VNWLEQSSDLPIGELLRELTPQVLGLVVRRFRDFDAAEDAVQEASIAAVMQWPRDGVPDNPRAWLTQVAFRKMTDLIRRESARRRREMEVVEAARVSETGLDAAPVEDDALVLLFMCCHPALTPSSAIALTLRAVGGLTTKSPMLSWFRKQPWRSEYPGRSRPSRYRAFHSKCPMPKSVTGVCARYSTFCT